MIHSKQATFQTVRNIKHRYHHVLYEKCYRKGHRSDKQNTEIYFYFRKQPGDQYSICHNIIFQAGIVLSIKITNTKKSILLIKTRQCVKAYNKSPLNINQRVKRFAFFCPHSAIPYIQLSFLIHYKRAPQLQRGLTYN